MKTNIKFFGFSYFLICILPIFLISGPFISDLTVTYLALSFLLYCIYSKKTYYFKNKIFLYFIIVYLYLNINSFFSFDYTISLKSSLPFLRIILFTIAVSFFVNKFDQLNKHYFTIFFVSIIFLFLYSYFIIFFKQDFFGNKTLESARITSFFGSEEIMGSYISRLLPLAVGLSYLINIKHKKKIIYSLFILSGILILLSGERLSLFFFIFFLFFYLILDIKKHIYIILIFFISLGSVYLSNPKSIDRHLFHTLDQIKSTSNTYLSFRHTLHYITAYEMFLDKPITGHGLKSFRNLCDKFTKETDILIYKANLNNQSNKKIVNEYPNGCNTHPHNIYLEFLSELGIIGFFLFSLIFVYVAYQLFCLLKLIIFSRQILSNKNKCLFLILAGIFITMFPALPSGSYFNNWMLIISYLPIGFYLGIKSLK
jgi:O-antigen ligase